MAKENVIVIGLGEVGQPIYELLKENPLVPIEKMGFAVNWEDGATWR